MNISQYSHSDTQLALCPEDTENRKDNAQIHTLAHHMDMPVDSQYAFLTMHSR